MESLSLDNRTITITPHEAADRLGLSVGTLANLRYKGGGPPYLRIGGRIRYRLSDLAGWMDNKLQRSTSDTPAQEGA